MIYQFKNYKETSIEILKKAALYIKEANIQFNLSDTYGDDGLEDCSDDAFDAANDYMEKYKLLSGFHLVSGYLDTLSLRKKDELYDVSKIRVSKDIYDEIEKLDIKIMILGYKTESEAEEAFGYRKLFTGFIEDKSLDDFSIKTEDNFVVKFDKSGKIQNI